jgi:hypothetical protein
LPGEAEENYEKSVRFAGLQAEIWTRNLPNTKQGYDQLGRSVKIIIFHHIMNMESLTEGRQLAKTLTLVFANADLK